MKFTPEVIAALQVLREHAENDFERHRINVLERDLTAPPKVEVIDDTHQRFNGVIYYKNKQGHFHKDIQLHRAVFAYYNGEELIAGSDIHHMDINPANNNINNLQLLTRAKHQTIHSEHRMETPLERVCPICGKIFIRKEPHSKYCSRKCYIQSKRTFQSQEKICPICLRKFSTIADNPKQKYCSRACANEAKTFHNRNKICPVCGKAFVAPPIKPNQIYCSRSCSAKGHTAPRIEKSCPVCGNTFQVNPESKKQKVCCSKSCAQKYHWQKIKATHTNNKPLSS